LTKYIGNAQIMTHSYSNIKTASSYFMHTISSSFYVKFGLSNINSSHILINTLLLFSVIMII